MKLPQGSSAHKRLHHLAQYGPSLTRRVFHKAAPQNNSMARSLYCSIAICCSTSQMRSQLAALILGSPPQLPDILCLTALNKLSHIDGQYEPPESPHKDGWRRAILEKEMRCPSTLCHGCDGTSQQAEGMIILHIPYGIHDISDRYIAYLHPLCNHGQFASALLMASSLLGSPHEHCKVAEDFEISHGVSFAAN